MNGYNYIVLKVKRGGHGNNLKEVIGVNRNLLVTKSIVNVHNKGEL